jgi:hypothetical protein
MNEMEEWFLNEFGHLGFSLTHLMYNPENFVPLRGVLYTYPINDLGYRRCVKLRTSITPELANDLHAWGRTHQDNVNDYRVLIVRELQREVEDLGLPIPNFGILKPKDFKPIQKLNKFKL